MKIGIFDSGLGGLLVTRAIIKKLPGYDYLYLGDTKRMPYGGRTQKEIFKFTCQALDYLFRSHCKLVIVACNTASAKALRKIQREYLPKFYPDKKVLGVIIPTVEVVAKLKNISRVGILATKATVGSKTYLKEFKKLNSNIKVSQQAAPLLATLVERGAPRPITKALLVYITQLLKTKPQAIILGCTHYSILKNQIKNIVGPKIKVIDQDKIIAEKLALYLKRHPEIEQQLTKYGKRTYAVTAIKNDFNNIGRRLFGGHLALKSVKIS